MKSKLLSVIIHFGFFLGISSSVYSQTIIMSDDFEMSDNEWQCQIRDYYEHYMAWSLFNDPLYAIQGNKSLIVSYSSDSGQSWQPGYSDYVTEEIIAFRHVNAVGNYNLLLQFDWKSYGENGYDYGLVGYSVDSGKTFFWIQEGGIYDDGYYVDNNNVETQVLYLPDSLNNRKFTIAFRWINDGSVNNGEPFMVDKLSLQSCLTCKPIADFAASTSFILKDGYVEFRDNSKFSPTKWSWSFPGGTPSTSNIQNPVVVYPVNGVYDVSLTVSNANGSNTMTKNYLVTVDDRFYEDFETNNDYFSYSSNYMNYWYLSDDSSAIINGNQSLSIGYLDSTQSYYIPGYLDIEGENYYYIPVSSKGTTNNFISFRWKCGGGDNDFDYGKVGIYDIINGFRFFTTGGKNNDGYYYDQEIDTVQTLYLPDYLSNSNFEIYFYWTNDGSVNVGHSFIIDDFEVKHDPFASPIAQFSANPGSIYEGTTIKFKDESIRQPEKWQWNFEGGIPSSSISQHPEILFQEKGQYKVSLIVSNKYGTDTFTGYIDVVECNGTVIRVITNTDNYGEETFWELTDISGTDTIYSIPKGQLSPNTEFITDICVDSDKEYLFSIHDGYGDGMCCDYGYGSYRIESNCYVLAEGGEFSTTEKKILRPYPSYKFTGEFEKYHGNFGSQMGYAVINTCEGGYAVVGYNDGEGAGKRDVNLVKVNPKGEVQWSKNYGFSRDDEAYIIRQTNDGGFILGGQRSLSRDDYDIYLIKTDYKGDTLWTKLIGDQYNDDIYDITLIPEGGYFLSCTENNNAFMMKINSQGEIQWKKSFKGSYIRSSYFSDDGNLNIILYESYYQDHRCVIKKIDTAGNIIWSRFQLIKSDMIRTDKCTDQGFIILNQYGEYDSFSNYHNNVIVIKTDSTGKEEWRKVLNEYDANSIIQAHDNGFLLLDGHKKPNGVYDLLLIKLNLKGEIEWENQVGVLEDRSYIRSSRALLKAADGGYIITGGCADWGYNNYINHDIFIIKTDSAGKGCFYEPFQNEEICMVTVDPSTGKNLIVWNKTSGMHTKSYNIYRESYVVGVYDLIGNVPFDSLSVFEDTDADPKVKSERYRISVINECDKESQMSPPHATLHLTANKGVGDEVNLIWEPYEGFNYESYKIYRGKSNETMQLIADIKSNIFSYSDINPPAGKLLYQVSVVKGDTCDPLQTRAGTNSGPFSQSLSNMKEYRINTAPYLFVNPSEQVITKSKGSSATFSIVTNLDTFEVSCTEDWITLTTNTLAKFFIATANSSSDENRMANITISGEEVAPQYVTVTQGDLSAIELVNQESAISINPNPFRDKFDLSYYLTAASQVKIELFNSLGVRIATLQDDYLGEGYYSLCYRVDEKDKLTAVLFLKINIAGKTTINKIIHVQ